MYQEREHVARVTRKESGDIADGSTKGDPGPPEEQNSRGQGGSRVLWLAHEASLSFDSAYVALALEKLLCRIPVLS
jgi:hypothetical protein